MAYVGKTDGRTITADEACAELEDFIEGGDLDIIDDDEQPRIILAAAGFLAGVTSTVLLLRRLASVDRDHLDHAPEPFLLPALRE